LVTATNNRLVTESASTASIRLDKWLWAARCYKTRSLATAACKANHVKCNGHTAKPAQSIDSGDKIEVNKNGLTRTYIIRELLERRVGAALLDRYREDVTPQAELDAAIERRNNARLFNAAGTARPTKRDRRRLENFRDHLRGE
jgi:ribosome-associated heat shock protein Hsp15